MCGWMQMPETHCPAAALVPQMKVMAAAVAEEEGGVGGLAVVAREQVQEGLTMHWERCMSNSKGVVACALS